MGRVFTSYMFFLNISESEQEAGSCRQVRAALAVSTWVILGAKRINKRAVNPPRGAFKKIEKHCLIKLIYSDY